MFRHAVSDDVAFLQDLPALPLASCHADATALQADQPSGVTGTTMDKIEKLLGASGANLVYAGYPYDPFALDTSKH